MSGPPGILESPWTLLQALGRALQARSTHDGARRLLEGLTGAPGLHGGLIVQVAGKARALLASRGLPEGWEPDLDALLARGLIHEPLDAPPLLLDTALKAEGICALLALPLGRAQSPDGAIVLVSRSKEPFPEAQRRELQAVATALGAWLRAGALQPPPPPLPPAEPPPPPLPPAEPQELDAGEVPRDLPESPPPGWIRSVLAGLETPAVCLGPGGRIRELGPGWLEGAQAEPAEWRGRHLADLLGADRSEVLAALRTTAREGAWSGRFIVEGRTVPLRLTAARGEEGRLEAIVGFRALGAGLGLVGQLPFGMLLLGRDLRILEANPELRVVCGEDRLPAEPAGLDVRTLAIFQTREAQTALEGLRDGSGFDLPRLRLGGPEGAARSVAFRGRQVFDAAGAPLGWILVLSALPGTTDMERQLVQAQKMESIGSFASGLAHDFGNFLSVILGKAGVLRVKLPDDPHIVRELDDIDTAAKRALHLAQELMKFARGGRTRVASLSINELIREVDALIRTSIGKRIELRHELRDDVCSVEGDEVELQQLILNLCLNARDAMPNGGTLTLETGPLSADQLSRLETRDNVRGGVSLVVRDTGTGMPPEVVERIFEPFFSTKDDSCGTGLGLAMVYGVVRRHGGAIDVRSAPGEGTAFEIALPAARAQGKKGHDILVVDDEPAFREMIRLILEEDGHQALLAANGIEALRILREQHKRLGLVILDLRMPGLDGLGVLRELRGLAADLPVLVATGYASDEEKQEAMDAGAGKILQKPYRVADLRAALAELLGALPPPPVPPPAREAGSAAPS